MACDARVKQEAAARLDRAKREAITSRERIQIGDERIGGVAGRLDGARGEATTQGGTEPRKKESM